MGRSGKIWEHLGRSGKIWISGNIWEDLGRSGKIWEDLGRSGKIWEDLGRSGKIWKDLGGSDKIWEDWGRIRSSQLKRRKIGEPRPGHRRTKPGYPSIPLDPPLKTKREPNSRGVFGKNKSSAFANVQRGLDPGAKLKIWQNVFETLHEARPCV